MKARFRRCLPLVVLAFASCSSPDSALFSDNFADGPPATGGSSAAAPPALGGSAASAAGGSVAGSSSDSGAAANSGGGSHAGANSAGSSNGGGGGLVAPGGGAAGSLALDPSAGSSSVPDGAAGANDGGSGSTEPSPVCGNGKLEPGEQCDDEGHAGQDGCNADCKVVCNDFGEGAKASSDHHCYNGYDSASFEGSQQACIARGGHLATISSEAENEIARSFVKNSKWIGGFEDVGATSEGAGDYEWLSGEPFTFENWDQGEPDRADFFCGGGPVCYEHCITLLGDGGWIDNRCDLVDGYVCEWEPAGD